MNLFLSRRGNNIISHNIRMFLNVTENLWYRIRGHFTEHIYDKSIYIS